MGQGREYFLTLAARHEKKVPIFGLGDNICKNVFFALPLRVGEHAGTHVKKLSHLFRSRAEQESR